MKKTLIAGAASFAFAAMPIVGVFATDPAAVIDTLTVNVNLACTFARTSGSGNYSATLVANELNTNVGTSTFTSNCNNATGYSITATFTNLTYSGAASTPINYSTSKPTAGSGTWTALLGSATTGLTSGAAMATQSTHDPSGGRTYTVKYQASVRNNQPKGTYTGTATYQLSTGS